jgi:hypothetical protein
LKEKVFFWEKSYSFEEKGSFLKEKRLLFEKKVVAPFYEVYLVNRISFFDGL